jgi:hypothetical protein
MFKKRRRSANIPMSLNRLQDDSCTYAKVLRQSVNPLEYTLDPIKYQHCKPCRMQLGTVGGTAASRMTGASLVDTESELRNQTRAYSLCPANKYVPGRDMPVTGMQHLPACQMVHYKPVSAPVWVPPARCTP